MKAVKFLLRLPIAILKVMWLVIDPAGFVKANMTEDERERAGIKL